MGVVDRGWDGICQIWIKTKTDMQKISLCFMMVVERENDDLCQILIKAMT